MKKNILLTLSLALAAVYNSDAAVRLSHLIGDNMVLQQQSEASLWGWDKPGKEVKVSVSWSKDKYSVKTGSDGKWLIKVKTPAASMEAQSITFDDGDKTTLHDILIGEVWVCAGQSNMEMPVRGFDNCPVDNYNKEVLDGNNHPGVRSIKIPSVMSMTPLDDADAAWRKCTMATMGDFSATGYFFARVVSDALGIPVGLIEANKGGTRVESWMTAENLKKYTDDPLDSMEIVKKYSWDYHRPLLWGNGTFNPILNYTVKGILFYQGCSNVGNPGNQYSENLARLVEQWRQQFGQGDIPFYFVEIAPYYYDNEEADWGARLREQQQRASQIIPNAQIVGTNDCVYPYEKQQIHPAQKQKVGERLAFKALKHLYGMSSLIADAPTYKSMDIKGDSVFVQLDNLNGGISRYEDIQGFEICGADKVYHKANAIYYWTKGIILTSPEVKEPKNVRYCFKNFQIGNVANQGGLPLFPFRTDDY